MHSGCFARFHFRVEKHPMSFASFYLAVQSDKFCSVSVIKPSLPYKLVVLFHLSTGLVHPNEWPLLQSVPEQMVPSYSFTCANTVYVYIKTMNGSVRNSIVKLSLRQEQNDLVVHLFLQQKVWRVSPLFYYLHTLTLSKWKNGFISQSCKFSLL